MLETPIFEKYKSSTDGYDVIISRAIKTPTDEECILIPQNPGQNLPNPRMKPDRCLRSVVDSARGRAVMGWGWLLGRTAAAAYAERWAA